MVNILAAPPQPRPFRAIYDTKTKKFRRKNFDIFGGGEEIRILGQNIQPWSISTICTQKLQIF